MKSLFLTVLFSSVVLCLFSQTFSNHLAFEEKTHDFGNILEKNGEVSHTFVFTNTSDVPLAISQVSSGCGCAKSTFLKTPIKPGESGWVKVGYNPAYRPGFFSKEVVVYFNNQKHFNRIWIKGNVIPFDHPVEEDYPYYFGEGLHLSLKVLAFGYIGYDQSKHLKVRYANENNYPIDLKFQLVPSDKNLTYVSPGIIAPKSRGEIVFNYTMLSNQKKEIVINISPVVNNKKLNQTLIAKISGLDK